MMNKISIGKMASLNQVTEQTLRHYDKIGLLKPAYIDINSKYRYYDIKQSAKLDMIQYMKALGMSLEQIKEQFQNEDIQIIQQMLHKQRNLIDYKIQELQNMRTAVDTCINNYNRYLNKSVDGRIELEYMPARKIFCYDVQENIYEYNLEGYEYILRELKQQVTLQHLPMVYFCNVGSIIRKDSINLKHFSSSEIFLFVDENYTHKHGIQYIPENYYLCIYCHRFEEEIECAKKLIQYIQDHNYEIIGDYICEVVIELPIFYHDERHMLIKLQIPIRKPLTLL